VPVCQSTISNSSAYYIASNDTCVNILSDKLSNNSVQPIGNVTIGVADQGLVMRLKESPILIKIVCNPLEQSPIYKITNSTIEIQLASGCGNQNYMAMATEQNRYKFSVLMLGIGVALLMVMGCEWSVLIGILAFISGFGLVWYLFMKFINFSLETTSVVVISLVAIGAGALLSYFCQTSELISLGVPGFAFGVLLTQYNLVIFHILLDQVI
jgi:hypothetical protein